MMKNFFSVVAALCLAAMTTGCGTSLFNSSNSGTNLTNVELSKANYRIVKNIEGFSSASYILGIGGLSRKATRDNAVADMMRKAKLTGSQAVVNVHIKNHFTTVLGLYMRFSVSATAQVIEFLPEAPVQTAEVSNHSESAASVPSVESQAMRYAIGDLYDDGTKRGYIFEISDDGKHGKIVYPEILARSPWCTQKVKEVMPGKTDEFNGEKNMKIIQSISGWQTNYPAFTACVKLGYDWYLPAIEDLVKISATLDYTPGMKAVIRTIKYSDVWSSTKSGKGYAQTLLWKKVTVTKNLPVIAVAKF